MWHRKPPSRVLRSLPGPWPLGHPRCRERCVLDTGDRAPSFECESGRAACGAEPREKQRRDPVGRYGLAQQEALAGRAAAAHEEVPLLRRLDPLCKRLEAEVAREL